MPSCGRCGAKVIVVELSGQPDRQVLLDPDVATGYALVVAPGAPKEHAKPVFTYQEHRCGDLTRLAELVPLGSIDLDELVHDAKGTEAARIDNSGKVDQLAFLTGVRPEVVTRHLEARRLPDD